MTYKAGVWVYNHDILKLDHSEWSRWDLRMSISSQTEQWMSICILFVTKNLTFTKHLSNIYLQSNIYQQKIYHPEKGRCASGWPCPASRNYSGFEDRRKNHAFHFCRNFILSDFVLIKLSCCYHHVQLELCLVFAQRGSAFRRTRSTISKADISDQKILRSNIKFRRTMHRLRCSLTSGLQLVVLLPNRSIFPPAGLSPCRLFWSPDDYCVRWDLLDWLVLSLCTKTG